MTYVVKIAGQVVPFPRSGGAHEWRLQGGVTAPIQAWELPSGQALRILAAHAGQEVELELGARRIRRAIVLGNAPSGDPQTQLLVMSDVRWYWSRSWIVHDFNVRRRVGDRRLVGDGDTPAEVRANVVDVQYAGWSLNGANPWTYGQLLEHVKKDGEAARVSPAGSPVVWRVDPTFFLGTDRVVEETSMDDAMPSGLARALGAIPGRSLYVDDDGVVHVYDALPGAERYFVGRFERKLPPELLNHGSLEFLDLSASRPPVYRVLFTPEVEIKLTYDPLATVGRDDPWMENVLEVPDATLAIPATGGRAARTVAQGTYVTHAEAYAAWGAGGIFATALTDDIVRAAFLGQDLERTYVNAYGQPDLEWLRRIRAVKSSYRTLFRVNPRFWGRVLSARAVRVKILDEETGTRAPSPVFANSAQRYSTRALVARNTATGDNEFSYSENVNGATPARAQVTIEDGEQGILRVDWQLDRGGMAVQVAPSALEAVPNYDPGSDPLFNAGTWSTRKLVRNHQLATILSLVPAGPNDVRRLCEVKVTLQEVMQSLQIRGDVQPEQQEAKGPEQTLRVSPQRATRRYGWEDGQDARDALLDFFRGDSSSDRPEPEDSLEPVNGEETLALAKAIAAADVVARLDHYEGSLAIPMTTAKVQPIGSITSVVYRVAKDLAQIVLHATHSTPPVDPIALLPAGIRKVLNREVQP